MLEITDVVGGSADFQGSGTWLRSIPSVRILASTQQRALSDTRIAGANA